MWRERVQPFHCPSTLGSYHFFLFQFLNFFFPFFLALLLPSSLAPERVRAGKLCSDLRGCVMTGRLFPHFYKNAFKKRKTGMCRVLH